MEALVFLSALLLLPAPAPSRAQKSAPSFPRPCLADQKSSKRIAELLEAVADRPTAGGYNTLGALYAEQGELKCAIPAFESALRLDDKNWEARYNLALALMKNGERTRAAQELRGVIQQKPDSASAHNALGTLLQNTGKLDQAADEFKAVLRIDPRFGFASYNLAQVLMAQQRYPAAIFYLEKALALSPSKELNEELQIALGIAYAHNGDLDKAADTLRGVVAVDPNSAAARFNLGTVYAKKGQYSGYEAAAAEYREALRLDPKKDEARVSLARALLALEKYSDAIPVLNDYTERQPRDYEGYYLAGLAYKGLTQWKEAAELLARAERLNPMSYDIRYDFGFVLARAGQTEEAVRQLEAAARINPNGPEAHYQLALLLEKKHERRLAKEELAKFQALKARSGQETTAGNLNNEANRLLAEGDARAAVETYRKALELNPEDAQMHYNLSLALDKLGNRGAEQQELEKAVELNPNLSVAHNQLGLLALEGGKAEEAERQLKTALEINPQYAEAQNNLGVLYSREGRNSEAAASFEPAIRNDPQYVKAYVNLGLTLAKQGRYAEAEQQFHSAIKIAPNDEAAYTALGMVEAKTGRGQAAVETFRRALALDPNSPDTHVNLGIALVDQYDLAGGSKEFAEAIRLAPDSAPAHYNMGRFFFDTGKYNEARRELETATRLEPNYASALYFLALVEKHSDNIQRSTELLEKVVAFEPRKADAQYLLGQNLEKLGQMDAAIKHWKLAIEADPNHAQSLYNLSRTLKKLHDPEAKQFMDRFQALEMSQQLTDRVQQLGNFALEAANAQNWPQAVEDTKEALQLCGQCAQSAHLHKNLGLIYCRTGNLQDGEKELRAALQLDPNDEDAKKALEVLGNLRKRQAN